jgi:hypothetical protein
LKLGAEVAICPSGNTSEFKALASQTHHTADRYERGDKLGFKKTVNIFYLNITLGCFFRTLFPKKIYLSHFFFFIAKFTILYIIHIYSYLPNSSHLLYIHITHLQIFTLTLLSQFFSPTFISSSTCSNLFILLTL